MVNDFPPAGVATIHVRHAMLDLDVLAGEFRVPSLDPYLVGHVARCLDRLVHELNFAVGRDATDSGEGSGNLIPPGLASSDRMHR